MILLALGAALAPRPAFSDTYLLDWDDTVRVVGANQAVAAVARNLLLTRTTYAQIPAVLRTVINSAGNQTCHVISGSPPAFRGMINSMLKDANFPDYQLHLKPINRVNSIQAFKVDKIKEIISALPLDEKFVLLGDDTQNDADTFQEIKDSYNKREFTFYIHRVSGKTLPPGLLGFYTALDLAVLEHIEGRFPAESLEFLAAQMLEIIRTSPEKIFPHFAMTPRVAFVSNLLSNAQDPLPEPTLRLIRSFEKEAIRSSIDRGLKADCQPALIPKVKRRR